MKKVMISLVAVMCFLTSLCAVRTQAATTINVSTVSELHSTHPYGSNMDTTWVYTHPTAADGLKVTFSSDTFVENNYDYIYIYDGSGTQIGKYTGSTLASQTIEVTGNIVKIRLTSDSSITKQGFTVTGIEAVGTYSGSCGVSVNWSFTTATGELIVSGTGEMTNFSSSSVVPWSEYCSDIKTVTIDEGVISIGSFAFFECNSLTKIRISDGVTSIGKYAFFDCYSLTETTIPASITSIENGAFLGCENIVLDVFDGSYALEYATENDIAYICNKGKCGENLNWVINDGKLEISGTGEMYEYGYGSAYSKGWDNYKNEITEIIINEGATSIGAEAFYELNNVESVTFPSTMKKTGSFAFSQEAYLKNVYAPSIESWCGIEFNYYYGSPFKCYWETNFYVDGVLTTDIVIPDGVVRIGNNAFDELEGIKSVTIPPSVTSIGTYAFESYDIENVYISDLTAWCNIEFATRQSNPIWNGSKLYLNGVELENLVVPDDVTIIKGYTFATADNVKTVEIHEGVTKIESYAFSAWDSNKLNNLQNITFYSSDVEIGSGAFFNCPNVEFTGYAGSTAQSYAVANDIPFTIIGGAVTVTIGEVTTEHGSLSDAISAANSIGEEAVITLLGCMSEEIAIDCQYKHTIDLDNFEVVKLAVTGNAIIKNGTVTTLNVTGLVETENVTVTSTDAFTYGTDGTRGVYTSYDDGVSCVDGAQVRIGGGVSDGGTLGNGAGIRFIGQADFNDTLTSVIMDEHYADSAFDEGYGIGMKISAEESDDVIYIPVKRWQDEANGVFTVALTNLAENNYNRRFTARVYVEYNGIKIFGGESTTRSIYAIAAGLLKQSTEEEEQRLIDVLNAYVNHTGIRLVFKDNTLNVNDGSWDVNGGYTGDAFFSVGDTLKIGNTYYVGLTPVGVKTKLDVDNFAKYIRINNNNSQISGAVTLADNNDGTYTLTFNINNVG